MALDDLQMRRMEALVDDLTTALDSVTTRHRRWGLRRRARSTGNLPLSLLHKTQPSDESNSDIVQENQHSDSDMDPKVPHQLASRSCLTANLMESDSFNENFSPVHPNTRRKRKLKRMSIIPGIQHQKKRILRHAPNCQNRLNSLVCGKRKRSLREQSLDCVTQIAGRSKDISMDCEMLSSSSSLSSSESDNGIYTNDEGHQGDDEQSDWIGESTSGSTKVWWEEGEASDTDKEDTEMIDSLACREANVSQSGREIRSGCRRVRSERPGFSIQTSANEKLSRFLQDPGQAKLRLHPMQRREREQLTHLANLYSLELTTELACPVLTKTHNTMRHMTQSHEPIKLHRLHHGLQDCKRKRWNPHQILAPPIFNPTTSGVRGPRHKHYSGHKSS